MRDSVSSQARGGRTPANKGKYFNQGNIPIYAGDRVINALKRRFDYIFKSEGNIPGTPNVLVNEVLGD